MYWYRNQLRLGECEHLWDDLQTSIFCSANDYWKAARSRQIKKPGSNSLLEWSPPPLGWSKLNFDAAFSDNETVTACICRDSEGHIIFIWVDHRTVPYAFSAEAFAALQALRLATNLNIHKAVFEGDAFKVVQSLNGQSDTIEWTGEDFINEGRQFLHSRPIWKMQYISRHCNFLAHNVAQWAKSQCFCGYIAPSLIPPAVLCDRGGTESDVSYFSSSSINI